MSRFDHVQVARGGIATLVVALAFALAPAMGHAQTLDLCGCDGLPSLGDFVSNDQATWPAGTTNSSAPSPDNLVVPLPDDGVLVFDNMTISNSITNDNVALFFGANAANTPVTLLVKGNVTIGTSDRIDISGGTGGAGSDGSFGVGGSPSRGAFGGGDGAYQLVNFGADGGDGLGPGGGAGSNTNPEVTANGGTYVGLPELRPLLGGSGGGGGRSELGSAGCSGGGGGGGGGGILIAANGTVQITGEIRANGGVGGARRSSTCSSSGGGGSGGAIRIVALTLNGSGTMNAVGGTGSFGPAGNSGTPGRIRLEAISNTFSATGSNPIASRGVPGPIVDPIQPLVTITGIDGASTPEFPAGYRGQIDMIVPAPGDVVIDLETSDVPAGTTVEVKIKPKVRTDLIRTTTSEVLLEPLNCTDGVCLAAVVENLEPGGYIVEAKATFLAPSP